MNIIEWNLWMKEHHVYIPTNEEIEEAKKTGSAKVRPVKINRRLEKIAQKTCLLMKES